MMSRVQWESPNLFWIAVVVLGLVLTASLVFYRPQVRPLLRLASWAWVLPWVRTLGLGVLGIMLLRPAIMTPVHDDGRGIIAVLIDRSQSMNAVDAGQAPEQLVRNAAGLGLLDPSVRSEDLSQLHQRMADLAPLADEADRATTELNYALLAGRGMEAATAHQRESRNQLEAEVKLVAESASGQLRDEIAGIRADLASPQITQIRDQIDAMQVAADQKLYQTNAAVRTACNALAERSRLGLVSDCLATETFKKIESERTVQIFADSSSAQLLSRFDPANLGADEVHTDLVGQLRELHHRLAGKHVAAVVLFSDGRENNQSTPVDALVDWPDVPLIAVDVGSPQPKDLSIATISAPASVAVGENVRVEGSIRRVGFDVCDVEVALIAGQRRQVQKVRLSKESTDVEFSFTADRPGACRVTLAVTPQSGEATTANNQISRVIKVTGDRSTIAVISGSTSPDVPRLRALLKNAPGFALIDGPIESGTCRLTAPELRSADVLVLCDVPLSALDAQQWNAISSVVTQRDGSIIICAGEPRILASYATQPLIASMLPWLGDAQPAWRSRPGAIPGFHIVPNNAQAFDMIKLSGQADVNRLLWNKMPPVARIMSLPPLKQGVIQILSDHDSASPVLTQMKIGAGNAFFLGADELWSWDAASDGRSPAGQFWTEFIRMAGHPPYAITDGALGLDADHLLLEPGDALQIRARLPAADAKLRIERNGSLLQETSINPADAPNRRYQQVLTDVDAGNYTLRLIANDREISLPVIVAASDENEMRDVSGDHAELERIRGSRGAILSLAELPSLPQRLAQLQITATRFNETRLWDSPYLFMFVVGCFGVEWAVRKHVGLT